MTSTLRTFLELFRQSLLLQLRSRFVWLLLAASVLFPAVFLFIAPRAATHTRGPDLFGIPAYLMILQCVLPFAAGYLAVNALHGDIEDRSITYLFVRPIPRASILLARWLAVVVLATCLAWLALGLLFSVLALPDWKWKLGVGLRFELLRCYCAAAALAVPGYAAVGMLLAAFNKRPLISLIVFVLGWEYVVSNLPPEAGVRTSTVAEPVRRWLLMHVQPTRDLEEMLTGSLGRVDPALLGDPLLSLLKLTAIVLAGALWVFARREYESRAAE
jgi:multisubunit Na+/H+ antiporter MnhC subunit